MIFDTSGKLHDDPATTNVVEGVRRHDYLPFGEENVYNAAGGSRTAANGYGADGVRQQFTGHERDSETGLDFAQARYYASGQGRFASPDVPFADQQESNPQSWNLYTYVINNPLAMTDPTGKFSMPCCQLPPPAPTGDYTASLFRFFLEDYFVEPGQATPIDGARGILENIINPTYVTATGLAVADTNLVSFILRGESMKSLGVPDKYGLVITETVYKELLNTPGISKEGLDKFLQAHGIIKFTPDTLKLFEAAKEIKNLINVGNLSPDLKKLKGQLNDYAILAEAKALGLPLATNNIKDFKINVKGEGQLFDKLGVQLIATGNLNQFRPKLSDAVKIFVKKGLK
jgi:RHS repeat-associated protein